MNEADARSLLAEARSAHLATVGPGAKPHIVVVTFAVVGEMIVTAIDHKPKRTRRLQRLENIDNNPAVSILVDSYDEDWSKLWWVRADGEAAIHVGGVVFERAIDALSKRYDQYEEMRPEGPVIAITIDEISWWEASTQ